MKKTFALLLVLLLITGMLAACAEKEKEPDTPPSPPQPQYQDAKPLAEALDQAEGYNYTYIHETEYGKATISRNGDDVYILDESEDRINKTAYVKDTEKNQFRLYRFDLTENCWKQYVATPTQYQMNLQGLLEEMETGTKPSAQNLMRDAMRNPAFLASALGVIFGLLGIIKALMAGPFGEAYLASEQLLTAPMTAMILLVVGYSLKPELSSLKPCLQTILLRAVVQAGAIALTVAGLKYLMPGDDLLVLAAVIYMSAPATFSMQSFLKTKQGSAYAATVSSLYCFISIAVYAIAALVMAR